MGLSRVPCVVVVGSQGADGSQGASRTGFWVQQLDLSPVPGHVSAVGLVLWSFEFPGDGG